MWLEKSTNRVAYWCNDKNGWVVEDRKQYKWQYPDGKDATGWFKDFRSALSWIMEYDSKK